MSSENKTIKVARQVNQGLLSVETVILAVITVFLVACIFIEVFCRYFLFISVAWAEELTRYLFIWLTYIGSAYALYYGQHTEIDVLKQVIVKKKSSNRNQALKTLELAAIISTFCFLMVFAYQFFLYMMNIWGRAQTSPTMHIPMGWIYLPVFIGTVLSLLHEVIMLLETLWKKPEEFAPEQQE